MNLFQPVKSLARSKLIEIQSERRLLIIDRAKTPRPALEPNGDIGIDRFTFANGSADIFAPTLSQSRHPFTRYFDLNIGNNAVFEKIFSRGRFCGVAGRNEKQQERCARACETPGSHRHRGYDELLNSLAEKFVSRKMCPVNLQGEDLLLTGRWKRAGKRAPLFFASAGSDSVQHLWRSSTPVILNRPNLTTRPSICGRHSKETDGEEKSAGACIRRSRWRRIRSDCLDARLN